MCKALAKPYPKKPAEIAQGSATDFQFVGGNRIDLSAQIIV